MEQQEPGATFDDGMDSFLEKFQSQPYRGGFHESQWEEVGGPGVSARACVGVVPAPGASRAEALYRQGLALPVDRWFLLACKKSAPKLSGSSSAGSMFRCSGFGVRNFEISSCFRCRVSLFI